MPEVGTEVDYSFTNAAGTLVTRKAKVEVVKDADKGVVDLLVSTEPGDHDGSAEMRVANVYPNFEAGQPRERTYAATKPVETPAAPTSGTV